MNQVYWLLALLWYAMQTEAALHTPPLTVIIVIDQGGETYLRRLEPFFNYGFKTLFNQGVYFDHAHHPHVAPVTATGHAALNTGAFASDHGIIMNGWYDAQNRYIKSEADSNPASSVIGKHSLCTYGVSAKNLCAQGISEILQKEANARVFSLSYKARAAVGMGGAISNVYWYDEQEQMFTTSTAYRHALPDWLVTFNKSLPDRRDVQHWNLFYSPDHPVYQLADPTIYKYTAYESQLAGKRLPLNHPYKKLQPHNRFMITPEANQVLFDASFNLLSHEVDVLNEQQPAILWLSLSSLDKIGHMFGPTSLECIDMLCHLDNQLGVFITQLQQKYGQENVMIILTADHGVSAIPESTTFEKKPMRRISSKHLIKKMNAVIEQQYGISTFVQAFKVNQFFLNKTLLKTLPKKTQVALLQTAKKVLLQEPGIKKVWTEQELRSHNVFLGTDTYLYKKQFYPGRSGSLFCMTDKRTLLTKNKKGACHRTPYESDTRVPLIFYRPSIFSPKRIHKKIMVTQLPATLSSLFNVSIPSHANRQSLNKFIR